LKGKYDPQQYERCEEAEQTPVKERRKFDKALKREAVNNWLARGKSAGVTG
jgi:hypothetical protein